MKARRLLLAASALLGFGSVAAGAAIDHIAGSGNRALETALRYNQLYAVLVAALACALPLFENRSGRFMRLAAWLFVAGTTCFCGGIYIAELAGIDAFVYAAPVGGTTLMAAWLVVLVAAFT